MKFSNVFLLLYTFSYIYNDQKIDYTDMVFFLSDKTYFFQDNE